MIYGYYRVSSDDQTCESQRLGVIDYASKNNLVINKEYFDDGVSGAIEVKDRKLNNIVKQAKSGDKLIVSELSRIGRSTFDVLKTIHTLNKKGVDIYLVKQNMLIDQSPIGKLLVAIMAAFAEMERDLIIQRTYEGLERARREGKHLGRPFGYQYRKLESCSDDVRKMAEKGLNKVQLAKYFKCSWNTIHRFMREKKYEMQGDVMRRVKFNTMLSFRNLLEKQIDKNTRKPLKTAKEVLMLVDAILYDSISFEHFYTYGDNVDVWLTTDEKNKIVKISVGVK